MLWAFSTRTLTSTKGYNDAPGIQHADVMEVFDDAISLLE